MDTILWDFFEERIATLVLLETYTLSKAIGVTCRRHPSDSADVLLLAAISFVTHLDNAAGFVEGTSLLKSHRRYRVIAALAADVALLSHTNRTCYDLLEFWRSTRSTVFD